MSGVAYKSMPCVSTFGLNSTSCNEKATEFNLPLAFILNIRAPSYNEWMRDPMKKGI